MNEPPPLEAEPGPVGGPEVGAPPVPLPTESAKRPFYPRLLHLQHVHPNGWQRAVLGEGMAIVGGLLAMADLASAWSIVVLPAAVAAVVKGHDLLAGMLAPSRIDDGLSRPGNDGG